VSHLPEPGGNVDTTFTPDGIDNVLLRVDENSSARWLTPRQAAAPVLAELARDPSYVNLGTTPETFAGFPALRIEFLLTQSGVPVHKIDEFFTDGSGHSWAVLVEAPASTWAQYGTPLKALRQTFQATGAQPSGPSDAVYVYWSQLELGNYAAAFDELTPAEQQRVGGRAKFLGYFQGDPVLSADVNVDVSSASADQATVAITSLQTRGAATGCRNWSGSYRVVYEEGAWLIDYADLHFTAC
jgi:hypothetical protein